MTNAEIIKALEEEIHLAEYVDSNYCNNIEVLLIKSALDLINRQKAEIERLTINMNAFGLGMKREKERADTIRAEAIKEFAERYKALLETELTWCECVDEITKPLDNLVKEMVGET